MVSRCFVRDCTSHLGTPDIKLYRIPVVLTVSQRLEKLSTQRRKTWIKALGRPELTDDQLKSAKVCSRHFISGRTVSLTEVSSPDWVPNMNLGTKASGTRMIFKQEHIDDGSSADEQIVSDVGYEDDTMEDTGVRHVLSDDIVDEDEHEEIVLEPSPQTIVTRPQVIPATTTIKKITVTPVSGATFSGRKVIAPKASPIYVTQKMLQTPRTVTVVPKGDPTFRFTQGQTTIKRKLDSSASPVVVKLPMDLKRFKTVPARALGNFVVQQQKDPMAGVPKIVRLVRNKLDRATQTDVSGELLDQFQALHDENQVKIAQLEEQVRKCKYTPEMFENDDKRTEYFTGLDSYVTMITLYNTCESELPQSTALTKFEIFILTLLKLRLKLPLTFLAYQFCISPKAASFYFNECLNVLHKSLRELFAEPSDGQDGSIEIVSEDN